MLKTYEQRSFRLEALNKPLGCIATLFEHYLQSREEYSTTTKFIFQTNCYSILNIIEYS